VVSASVLGIWASFLLEIVFLEIVDHQAQLALGFEFGFNRLFRTDLALLMIRPVEACLHESETFFEVSDAAAQILFLDAFLHQAKIAASEHDIRPPFLEIDELAQLKNSRMGDGEPCCRAQKDRIYSLRFMKATFELLDFEELPGNHPGNPAKDFFLACPALECSVQVSDPLTEHCMTP
jgi:hypothetical protein